MREEISIDDRECDDDARQPEHEHVADIVADDAQTMAVNGCLPADSRLDLVRSDHNWLFRSGTLGRYSKVLHSVVENRS